MSGKKIIAGLKEAAAHARGENVALRVTHVPVTRFVDLTDMLPELCRASLLAPELRLGQLIVVAARKGGWIDDDVFNCPDATMAAGLKIFIEEFTARRTKSKLPTTRKRK
jgi:hypothetical protein